MVKVRVLEINGRNIDIELRELKEDQVKLQQDSLPFESQQIFTIAVKKLKNKVTLKRRPCLIHVAGKSSFTSYKEITEDFEGITNRDRKQFVMRSLARALTNIKPISTTQFIVICALIGLSIAIMILGFSGKIGSL